MATRRRSFDIDDLQRRMAACFASHPELAAVYLFGSVARGEANDDSDLDLGVVYRQRSADRSIHDRIATALLPAVGIAVGFEVVDIVDLEAQGPIFCHAALCEGRLVYQADPLRRIDFESETVARALDFRPTYELATQGKAAALRHWLRQRFDLRPSSERAGRAEGEPRQARSDPPEHV